MTKNEDDMFGGAALINSKQEEDERKKKEIIKKVETKVEDDDDDFMWVYSHEISIIISYSIVNNFEWFHWVWDEAYQCQLYWFYHCKDHPNRFFDVSLNKAYILLIAPRHTIFLLWDTKVQKIF